MEGVLWIVNQHIAKKVISAYTNIAESKTVSIVNMVFVKMNIAKIANMGIAKFANKKNLNELSKFILKKTFF